MSRKNDGEGTKSHPRVHARQSKHANTPGANRRDIAVLGLCISLAGFCPALVGVLELAGMLTLEQWAQLTSIAVYPNVLAPIGLMVSLYAWIERRSGTALLAVVVGLLGAACLMSAIESAVLFGDGPIAQELRRWGFSIEPHAVELQK